MKTLHFACATALLIITITTTGCQNQTLTPEEKETYQNEEKVLQYQNEQRQEQINSEMGDEPIANP